MSDKKYSSQYENVLVRDEQFTEVVKNFAEHQKNKDNDTRKQKKIFFWVVCICFAVVVLGSTITVIIVALNPNKRWEDFGVALSSVTGLISVIIVLPTKIAEHLFPADGEKDFAAFFSDVHEVDLRIRNHNIQNGSDSKVAVKHIDSLIEAYDKYISEEA